MPKSNELVVAGFLGKLKPAAEAGEKGDYRKAIQILRKLLSETEAPAEAWLLLGRSFHALKDYSQALAGFSEYIRQKPDSPEGYLFLGRSYLAAQMPYRAVPYLRKALEKSPGSSNAKALLGIAYLKSKNSGAAVEMLQAAVEDAPANKRIYRAYLNALMVRGIRLCGNEEYDLGFQILTFVLANADEAGMADSPILRLELGRAARETGRMQEALKHFDEALKLSGNDRRIRWSRASVLMSLGRNDEARTDIENIRSHDNNVPNLPWNSELVDLFMIRSFIEAG
ncbi:MAG: tetratricopeptide repeat protein, partial [Treponema sp.]|nr:tetratricopeptide repeat protein [Treponema sp.]